MNQMSVRVKRFFTVKLEYIVDDVTNGIQIFDCMKE